MHNLETHDEAEVDNGASLPEQLYFHTLLIDQVTKNDTQAFLEVVVEADQRKKPLLCKVDAGAEGNVISLNSYKSLFPSSRCNPNGIPVNLASSSTTIVAFGGHPVDHHGICHLKLAHGNSSKSYPFHVVDADGPTILGLPTCTDLNASRPTSPDQTGQLTFLSRYWSTDSQLRTATCLRIPQGH